MNIRDLKYFVAVAQFQHFGKAADACFVSQPALSAQLKKLEETLGVTLFERNNKHVMLTPIGRECLNIAQAALLQVEELISTAKQSQDPMAGELRLGVIPTVAPYFLPQVVSQISQQLPKLTLLLEEQQTAVVLKKLAEGTLDAGIIALPVAQQDFEVYSLCEDEFLLALPLMHPFAKSNCIQLDMLAEQTLLLLEEGHCLRDQALSFCHLMKVHERKDFRATSLETLRQMVIAGVGMTVMPKMAAKEQPGIVYREFAAPIPKREIALITRPTFSRKPLLKKLQEIIKSKR